MEYRKIINEICNHKDFGKRNPVDIGIECGYSEKDVLKAIKTLSDKLYSKADSVKQGGLYYFLVRKKENAYIILLNTNSWKITFISQVEEYNQDIIYDIKDSHFVRNLDKEKKILLWENLDTGKARRLLTDREIKMVMILNFGVLVIMNGEWLIWDGEQVIARKLTNILYFDKYYFFIKVKNNIYYFNNLVNRFAYIDDKLEGEFIENDIDCFPESGILKKYFKLYELGEDRGKLFGYGAYERRGVFFSKTNKSNFDYPMRLNSSMAIRLNPFRHLQKYPTRIIRDYVTKNYMLLGIEIYSRRDMESEEIFIKPVCYFERNIYNKQVIVDYEKDIFIGIDENDNLIKIDLQNERTPVVLPVDMHE